MTYRQTVNMIANRRREQLRAAEMIIPDLIARDKEFADVELRLRGLRMDKRLGKNVNDDQISLLLAERDRMLHERGITQEMLHPAPVCARCNDTGLCGGKPCSCVLNMLNAQEGRQLHRFSQCDLSLYLESDRLAVEHVYSTMRKFCDKFPRTNKHNILLMGKCGTGKTFLAECVVSELRERGHSATFVTAFDFVNRMLAYHTTFNDTKLSHLEPLIDCDLLVIDDLGSESILRNVTVEYLYAVINERMSHGKHTLITTNLDDGGLRDRYTERVAGRLFGSSDCIGFALGNKGLR